MKKLLALVFASTALVGCVSDDESVAPTPPNTTYKALYNPSGGIFPFPNDVFFSGSVDGTVNLPVVDASDNGDFNVAMNALDGFGLNGPLFIPFSGPLDPATVSNADVIIINTGTFTALVPGTDYSVAVSGAVDGGSVLTVTILRPLSPKTTYAVIVPRTVSSLDGDAAVSDTVFQVLLDLHGEGATPNGTPPASLTALLAAVDPVLDAANLVGVTDANNLVSFSFRTQSTSDVLANVQANVAAGTSLVAALVGTNKSLLDPTNSNAAITISADVYIGFIAVPYYQSRSSVLGGHWRTATGAEVTRYTALANVGPAATETLNFPIIVTVPNGGTPGNSGAIKPGGGWPVAIFQHGITGNRTNLIAAAQALAGAGMAAVAMDHPLHGLPVGHALRVSPMGPFTITEPTFDADLTNNTTLAPGADGIVDASGQNYINLSSLLTSRDNLRQTVTNLQVVNATLANLSYDGIAGGDFNTADVHFIGHSLGAITGTTFLGVNTSISAATLAMPGGRIAQLLRDSATFGPRINAGLSSNGVQAGTQLYEVFMQAAQSVVDSSDPVNFGTAANANHALHLIQVVGTSSATSDRVVPNSATARLIAALGLSKRSTVGAFANTEGYVNFVAGDHSSILNPVCTSIPTSSNCALATVEMQTEMATFMATDGAAFTIANSAMIEP